MHKLNLLSLNITTGSYETITKSILELAKERISSYTCVANVHMLIEAHNDVEFANVINQADITTADGKPITWALRKMYHVEQERVAGMDLLPSLICGAAEMKIPVYFLGGTEDTLDKTRSYAAENCKNLQIAGTCSPPFRTLSAAEEQDIIDDINASGAGLVLVAMGCPKQERWMSAMKGRIQASMVGIGGALPVMIGQKKRAPVWMQNAGLEWVYRLAQEPHRLFRRYAITNTTFIWLLARQYFSSKFFMDHQPMEDYTGLN